MNATLAEVKKSKMKSIYPIRVSAVVPRRSLCWRSVWGSPGRDLTTPKRKSGAFKQRCGEARRITSFVFMHMGWGHQTPGIIDAPIIPRPREKPILDRDGRGDTSRVDVHLLGAVLMQCLPLPKTTGIFQWVVESALVHQIFSQGKAETYAWILPYEEGFYALSSWKVDLP
jgi:hypothetical protein